MKVKIKEYTEVEKELELEYPYFLYFQSELGEDEIVKVFEKYKISVFFTLFGVEIKQEKHYRYSEHQILNNLTTEEHFDDSFEEALQHLVKLRAGL
jgi:hypothetical protein